MKQSILELKSHKKAILTYRNKKTYVFPIFASLQEQSTYSGDGPTALRSRNLQLDAA